VVANSTNSAIEVAQIFIKEIVRVFSRKLFQIEMLSSLQGFGRNYLRVWGQSWNSIQHIVQKQMGKPRGKIRMLRMYVTHKPKKWEEYLPLVEFAYNNGYKESINMCPFEALYWRSCNNPISWSDPMNMVLIGPDMLKKMEQHIQIIKHNLKVA